MKKPNSPFAEEKMTQTSKKLEEIPSITFDLVEVMPEWYSCDCNKSTYYANKATKFFQKNINSLLQEIEEKVIGEEIKHSPQITNAPHSLGCRNCRLNKLKAQQRKALKTIKERWI